jgi:Glycosyl hydrolase family 26
MGGRQGGPGTGRRRTVFAVLAVAVVAAGALVATALGLAVGYSTASPDAAGPLSASSPSSASASSPGPKQRLVVPDRSRFLAPSGGAKYFGVAAPHVPWRPSALSAIAKDAGGVHPDLVEYFVNWTIGFDPAAVRDAYAQHALPVITWEPWAGKAKGTEQPAYSLATIIDGRHDAYIRSFARAVKRDRWPVALRFGHEMNGHWYPWAERNGVNRPGQFVAAWKHVHDIFDQVGADNVIWIWAPNVLRGADPVSLKSLYPGDAYVDWIGMSAYDVTEYTASSLLEPTLSRIRAFTRRPLLITETGAQPGPQKAPWTTDFFRWLNRRPDVIGFVWFQYTRAQGGGADWTFTSGDAARHAFRQGVGTLRLGAIPQAHRA